MNTSLMRVPVSLTSALDIDAVARRRLTPLDRLSLRLGLWLLLRAARARAVDHSAAVAAHRAATARSRRERDWQRAALLSRPPV